MKLKQIAIATAAALSMGAAFAKDTAGSSTTSYNSQDQSYTSASSGSMSTQDKDLVRQVQQTLQSKGYNPGPIDGQWGGKTQAALKNFQKSQGSTASGSLDSSTLVALGVTQGSAGGTSGMGSNLSNTTNLNSSAGTSTATPDTSSSTQPSGMGSSSVNSTGSTSSSNATPSSASPSSSPNSATNQGSTGTPPSRY